MVSLVWAATGGGGARDGALSDFRDVSRLASSQPAARSVGSLKVTPRRIAFAVTKPARVSVEVHHVSGSVVRRLGHFTVSARQQLILAWDGRTLSPGTYVAVVQARGETVSSSFTLD